MIVYKKKVHLKGYKKRRNCQNKMCALMLQNFLLQHWPWHLQPMIQGVQCMFHICLCKYSTYSDIHQIHRDPRACNQIILAFCKWTFHRCAVQSMGLLIRRLKVYHEQGGHSIFSKNSRTFCHFSITQLRDLKNKVSVIWWQPLFSSLAQHKPKN